MLLPHRSHINTYSYCKMQYVYLPVLNVGKSYLKKHPSLNNAPTFNQICLQFFILVHILWEGHSHKFEKISPHHCHYYLVFNVKKIGRLFPTFVAFSLRMSELYKSIWVFYEYLMKTHEQELFFKNDFTPYMLLCTWRFFPTYHLTKHKKSIRAWVEFVVA